MFEIISHLKLSIVYQINFLSTSKIYLSIYIEIILDQSFIETVFDNLALFRISYQETIR